MNRIRERQHILASNDLQDDGW